MSGEGLMAEVSVSFFLQCVLSAVVTAGTSQAREVRIAGTMAARNRHQEVY